MPLFPRWPYTFSLFAFALVHAPSGSAQTHPYCAAVHPKPGVDAQRLPSPPPAGLPKGGDAMITIPTVVHVIHQGGMENISDEQVLSQFDVLNADFRRLNADTVNTRPIFQPVAADMGIEICLATVDPMGMPTTGIHRVFTTETTPSALIAAYGWDPARYMNIYVMPSGSCFSSMPWDPPAEDGIFITHGRFGTLGTAGSEEFAEFARFGRTGTHEVGHYLGLLHTFSFIGDVDLCFGGDSVCDTPPTDMRWMVATCLDHSLNTNQEEPDLPDQVENYMDYNVDSCANMFSEGQRERVHLCLTQYRSMLWSDDNLVSTGCNSVSGIGDIAQGEFTFAPNPAADFIDIRPAKTLPGTVELFSTDGGRVLAEPLPPGGGRISMAQLANGIYMLRYTTALSTHTERVVVAR